MSTALRDLRSTNLELTRRLRALRGARTSLDRTRAQFAGLFDFAPVTYAILDSAGIVVNVNLAGCRLLNVDRAHLVGHPLLAFVALDDRRELLEHLRPCRAGKDVVESEVRFCPRNQRDGSPVTCRLHSRRALYANRDAFPTVIIDQTDGLALERARLNAEQGRARAERVSEIARQTSASKDRFLAVVSHELRTLLTLALLAASRLARWEALDVVTINRNRITLHLETVEMHGVLRDAIDECSSIAEAKGVTLTSHLAATAQHVRGDRARLRQVVWNILNNAIKFTETDGRILVRSTDVSGAIFRVSVHDSGIGMDSAALERLFDPSTAPPVDQESRQGLGLGLAICKGIIGAHGGQIWGRSQGRGRGSTFGVELATVSPPYPDQESGPEPQGHPARELNATSSHLRVLVVEDDADSGEMLALFLGHHGHDVEVVSSLSAALNMLDRPWDVVLSDLSLPDGSGLDIARRMRGSAQHPRRLIALTGFGSYEDIEASRKAGFDTHLVKPVDLERLLSLIAGQP